MLEKLLSVAIEAGKLLEEGFYAHKEIKYKGTVDLVTQYDVAVENLIKERLSIVCPDFTLIAEESSDEKKRAQKAIYIDPIDGTTNFVQGIRMCAISIGVWVDNKPFIGIVYNPIMKDLFYAKQGCGAFLNKQSIHVSNKSDLQQSLLATGFPYTKVELGKDYRWVIETMKKVLPSTRDIRRFGSAALDLCYVAKGTLDGFYECNLKPWDVAAGLLIVQEAGGRISNDKNGTYDLSDHIIVATNGKNHDALIQKLANYDKV